MSRWLLYKGSEIGNYHKRKIPYFNDKLRYDCIYMTDYLKTLREENYTKLRGQTLKVDLGKNEYSEIPTCVEMIWDKTIRKKSHMLVVNCKNKIK